MDIKSLKDEILQLAIQGKLVPQNEIDESSSILLERIEEEKEQLIRDKIIKKEKPLPEIREEELLFEVPKGWEWCRLGNIANIIMGQSPDSSSVSEDKGGVEFHQGKTSFGKVLIRDSGLYCTKPTKLAIPDDILLSVRAPVGTLNITDRQLCIGRGLTAIRKYADIENKFFYYFIMALERELIKKSTGTTFKAVTSTSIKEFLIPLPPLEEQRRIIAKVEELFRLIEELDNNKQALLNSIDNARKKVLQLAIQGKLVEQYEDDEPASVLLEKIKEEKEKLIKDKVIKKERPLPEISCEEKLIRVPKGWEWCRFGRTTICRDGERVPVSAKDREDKDKIYDYYGASGIIDKIDKYLFDKELLLIGEDGANLVSRSTPIAFIAKGKYWVNNHAHVIDSLELTTLKYLEIYINAIDLKPFVTGTAQPKLNQANLNRIPIALPPLEEQKRIVDKVDLIFNYLSKLQREIETKNIIEDIIK